MAPTTPPTKDAESIIADDAASPNPADGALHVMTAPARMARTRSSTCPTWPGSQPATPPAPGDLEDQAARYHPTRHELTVNADFRAINDLTTHWHRRYPEYPAPTPSSKPTSANGANRCSSRSFSPPATPPGAKTSSTRSCPHGVHRRPPTAPSPARDAPEAPRSELGSPVTRTLKVDAPNDRNGPRPPAQTSEKTRRDAR